MGSVVCRRRLTAHSLVRTRTENLTQNHCSTYNFPVNGTTYFNYASNTLDKDFSTRWSGEGIGAEIIYNLGGEYKLDLIKIATLANKTYLYEIWFSNDGLNYTFYALIESNKTGDFENYPAEFQARYVKIIGKGQSSGSIWNGITEIEFYDDKLVSSEKLTNSAKILVYPNPAKEILFVKITGEK